LSYHLYPGLSSFVLFFSGSWAELVYAFIIPSKRAVSTPFICLAEVWIESAENLSLEKRNEASRKCWSKLRVEN
jgi:hypothetical protein